MVHEVDPFADCMFKPEQALSNRRNRVVALWVEQRCQGQISRQRETGTSLSVGISMWIRATTVSCKSGEPLRRNHAAQHMERDEIFRAASHDLPRKIRTGRHPQRSTTSLKGRATHTLGKKAKRCPVSATRGHAHLHDGGGEWWVRTLSRAW